MFHVKQNLRMMSKNFYCQNRCISPDFSIEVWDKAYQYCQENKKSEQETTELLEGTNCDKQCFDCMAIVGERRKKTQELITSNPSNK